MRPIRTLYTAALFCIFAIIGCSGADTTREQNNQHANVTLYTAEAILTQNQSDQIAEAVAVSQTGLILKVGTLADIRASFPDAAIDNSFDGKTILPGLIDPHVHMTLGAMMYGLEWIPPWDMPSPTGLVKGLADKPSLMARIAEIEAEQAEGPLILFGYHNLVQGDIDRHDLDAVTTKRPIFIWHYSGHDFYLNSAAIEMAKLTPTLAQKFHGVDLDKKGELTGRIYEDAALALFATLGPILLSPQHIQKGFEAYETLLAQGGVTTIAEMGYGIFGRQLEDQFLSAHYGDDAPYNLYLVPEHRAFAKEFGEGSAEKILSLTNTRVDIPVLKQVKLFTDAAFYSQTMKMKAPGYIGGQSKGTDGLWVTKPDALPALMGRYWEQGLDIHIHSNGDAAQDATLAAISALPDGQDGQRVILEHVGQMTPEQIEIAKSLPVGISAASHYVNYMGEDYAAAIGEKVAHITPLASTMAAGLPTTVHSDAPLAPPMPLHAASVHATRLTRQGTISTPTERLTPKQALRAITIEAAWSLGLEGEIGSIDVGKTADFTILEQNPLEHDPKTWDEIDVWGVMLKGKTRPLNDAPE